MSLLGKVFAGLRSAGLSEERALIQAERVVKEEENLKGVSISSKVASKGDKVQNGGTSIKEDIIAYGKARKGNTFTLAQMTASLGVSRNAISAELTYLVRGGTLNRVGRGEYVCNRGTC